MSQAISTRYSPGTRLGGRYDVVRALGWGGMAEVYLAVDRQLGREVAVKVIRERFAEDERFVMRFRREARAAASLSHPNVVAVHDVGVHQGSPFIVMEHVPGWTLAELVRDGGPMDPGRVAEIGEAVARALGAAHAAGIVHRDVKPGNVMVTADGRVKVLDFGIARALRWTPLTDTPAVQGTAEYMAPEYVKGDGADPRSDIYSLGVVLYELLAGRPPFTGDSPLQVAYKHLEEAPAPPDAVRPGLPANLTAVVMRCLAKHPGDRYRRAEELAADLGLLQGGRPAATAPIPRDRTSVLRTAGIDETPRPHRRRRKVLVGIVAGVAAGAVLVLALVLPAFLADADRNRPGRRPLRPPTALEADGRCGGFLQAEVALQWDPTVSTFADGYEIYRSTVSGGGYRRVAFVPGHGTTAYVDDDVSMGADYYYVVKSTTGRRDGPPSEQVGAGTPVGCFF
ncbi:MAG: protein kinase domain-containing protein [Actinomycetota bacterium]